MCRRLFLTLRHAMTLVYRDSAFDSLVAFGGGVCPVQLGKRNAQLPLRPLGEYCRERRKVGLGVLGGYFVDTHGC